MLIEKEVIAPGKYWYTDETTGQSRSLDVSSEMTKYWNEQGQEMLKAGLTIPVPYEHDFTAHPMTPKDKLLNNSGWIKEYRLHDGSGKPGDILHAVLDIQDEEVAKKLPRTIRWTSPWINSFVDGGGKQWTNVISHLALTTRPRIIKQQPFPSISAAMSVEPLLLKIAERIDGDGFCLSRAGRIVKSKESGKFEPQYPIAFALTTGMKFGKKDKSKDKAPDKTSNKAGDKEKPLGTDEDEDGIPDNYDAMVSKDDEGEPDQDNSIDVDGLKDPTFDSGSDVKMEELLCDLLQALGVPMPDETNENEFKRHLYEAAMSKIKELTSQGMGKDQFKPDQNKPPNQQPNASQPQNPLIQQEQQPMYMSLEEINKLEGPMKSVALAFYAENEKLRAELEGTKKTTDSLRDAKLKDATAKRSNRVVALSMVSKSVKEDLDKMLANPSMALSLGDNGDVIDPMDTTLSILEKSLKGLPNIPTMLKNSAALSELDQPTDDSMMTDTRSSEIADSLARMMGCPPEQKKAG